jgi:PAS domain S-box-containing protein
LLVGVLFADEVNISSNQKTVKIGILAYRPKPDTIASWQPLIDELNKELPQYHFEMLALNYQELEDAVSKSNIDFVFTNPEHYIALEVKYQVTRVATLVGVGDGAVGLKSFGGVIFTRVDRSDINTLQDIKGKRIAAVNKDSLGGFLAQAGELYNAGINISEDRGLSFTNMPHDKVVFAVRDAKADVGFVRTGVLENMAHDKKITLQEFKIINNKDYKGFPYIVSTDLYPEWPFAAMPNTDESLVKSVTAVLFQIKDGGDIAKKAGYYSWTIPMGYEKLKILMQKLRLYPFNYEERLTLVDALKKYALEFALFVLLGAIIMTVLYIRSQIFKRRLDIRTEALEEEVDNRRRIEKKLKLSASVFDHSSEGILITDSNNNIVEVNHAFEELTGYSKEDVIGQNPSILRSGKHDKDFYAKMFQEINEKGAWQGEIWNRNKSGEIYAELLSVSSIAGSNGKIDNYIAIYRPHFKTTSKL